MALSGVHINLRAYQSIRNPQLRAQRFATEMGQVEAFPIALPTPLPDRLESTQVYRM
jgi:hypothetical protein